MTTDEEQRRLDDIKRQSRDVIKAGFDGHNRKAGANRQDREARRRKQRRQRRRQTKGLAARWV